MGCYDGATYFERMLKLARNKVRTQHEMDSFGYAKMLEVAFPLLNFVETTGRQSAKEYPMPIYGTALLSLCLLTGLTIGRLIGALIGVDADIGGVGIAMLLLIVGCEALQRRELMKAPTQNGIVFWGQMYVPIVVAMAASQNVLGALSGGLMAILAGLSGVGICFLLVAFLAKSGSKEDKGA